MPRLILLEIVRLGLFLLRMRLRVWREPPPVYCESARRLTWRELRRYGLRLRVAGRPAPGFLVANHTTFLDSVIGMVLVPSGSVAKAEVANYLFIGPIARGLGCLFVDRHDSASRDRAKRALNAWPVLEKPLWVFPEGTTSPHGKLLPFRRGVFKAAEATGHPIQPVVFGYSTPLAAWSSGEGLMPGIHRALARMAQLEVRVYWMRPFRVRPGEAEAAAKALRRRMLPLLRALEAVPSRPRAR